jgi:hypothetical protein
MKHMKIGMIVIILGLVVVLAGFIPLTRRAIVIEEKIMEETEYRKETKTKEESYTEEVITGTESREEILLRESIPVMRGSTSGKRFELTAGDIIKFRAHSDEEMMISFTGQGEIYMSLEIGTDIEREFTVKKDGEYSLLYSSASVLKDIVIDFDIFRIYEEPVTELIEKIRTVEYMETVPYTVQVPYVEKTATEEQYTVTYFKYGGIGLLLVGAIICILSKKPSEQKKR